VISFSILKKNRFYFNWKYKC